MHAHGHALRTTLEQEAHHKGLPFCTSGAGTVFNAHFGLENKPTHYRDYARVDMATYTRFRAHMLNNGIQLLPDGRWYIGLTHSEKELHQTQEAIQTCIKAL
jgi:glutamate-1-semialdehyde 2,1-aminomutase